MLISGNVMGNIHDACRYVNRMKLSHFVLNVVPINGGSGAIIVYRAPDYPSVVHICERLGRRVPTSKEWFDGEYAKLPENPEKPFEDS